MRGDGPDWLLFLICNHGGGLVPAAPAAAADLNIGFVGGLTGAQANLAQDQLDGFKLAVKHFGGRLGGNEFGLTVLDDRHDPRTAKLLLERQMQSERTQVVLLSTEPNVIRSLVPVAMLSKTVLLNLNNAPPALAGKDCSPLFFSLSGLSETMHETAGLYLQLQGYKSLVLAGPDTAAERAAAAAFRRSFRGRTVQILSRHGEMNFENDFYRIGQVAPDGVYLLHTGGMAVNFIRQFADSRLKEQLPLFGPGTTFDQTVLAASGTAALDSFSVGPWSEDLDAPSNRRMLADFEAEYGRPASYYAAVGYDAAMLLDAALRAVDKKINDEGALEAALRRAEFPSTREVSVSTPTSFPF